MSEPLLAELLAARRERRPCALVTVAATTGSVPREAGAKMLVYADGRKSGTIGGGKFESLVVADTLAAFREKNPVLKTYPLHEGSTESFGAICGGEVTILIEPQIAKEALILVGAGHCAQAITRLARECGFHVTVLDDRAEEREACEADLRLATPAPEFIAGHPWQPDEALIIVSRNYQIDCEALAAALAHPGAGYVGMIGSQRKVRRVFETLQTRGVEKARLAEIFAPIGLDLGADSPAEIAVSVLAEVLLILRRRPGSHLRSSF